jgi:hypothetical protein
MHRLIRSLLCTLASLLIAAPLLSAQNASAPNDGVSLGDAARAQQARKARPSPNAKVYDNENLPKGGNLSTTTGDYAGVAAPAPAPASTRASSTARTGAAAPADKDTKTSEEAAKAQADEFRQKVDEAKKNIAQLEREIDVIQREERLRAAAFYGDIGGKVRPENMAKAQADTIKYNETLATKQAELDAAKTGLEQLREDIRKAGLPSSVGD